MGKKFSCVKKSRSRHDVRNEDDDNNQPENYSQEFQQYRRMDPDDHDQAVQPGSPILESLLNRDNPNVPADQTDSLNQYDEETTDEEIAAGLSHASTVLVQDSSSRPSVHIIPGPSQPVEPNPVLPMVILTTADDESIVLEPGGVQANPGGNAERPRQTARLALRRMLHLRRTGRLSANSSSASQKAKKWYKQMKGQIGWTLGKASSRAPKAKEAATSSSTGAIKKKQYQADDAQPGPSGIRKQQYQADDAQAGPSGIKKKQHQADDAEPGPSGIRKSSTKSETSSKSSTLSKKKESKKKKDKPTERRSLRENARSFEDNMNARLQYLRGGIISDPALSSYNMVSRPTSRERQAEDRHSWTSGLSGDESNRPRVLLLRRSPSRNIPLIPHVPSPSSADPDPVPSRSALTLNLPRPTIPSPPRFLGSPSSPAPERHSMSHLSQLDTRALNTVFRSRSANTLQVPSLRLPAFNVPGPEMPQEEPIPTTSAVPQRKGPLPMPDIVPLSAFARVPQRKRRFELSDVPQKEGHSPTLPGTPEEEQSMFEVPQKRQHFALSDVLSQKVPQEASSHATPEIPQEDSNTEQFLATSEVSTTTMSQIPLEDQPLALSEVSGEMVPLLEVIQDEATLAMLEIPQGGSSERHKVLQEKSSSVSQEEPSIANLDVSVIEQSLTVPEESGEEQMVSLPEIAQKESTFGKLQGEMSLVITDVTHKEQSPELPDIGQKEQPLALPEVRQEEMPEVSQEEPPPTIPVIHIEGPSRPVSETRLLEEPSEIRSEEPSLVPQQEPLPEVPRVEVTPRWIAVPESSHIDDSDYNSSD